MMEFDKLIECGKLAHAHGLVIGAGGNLSIRMGNDIWIKKQYRDMSLGKKEDYVRVPLSGLIENSPKDVSSEAPLHAACYQSNVNIKAVVHVHSPYSIAAAAKLEVLESPSYEFDCILARSVPVLGFIKPGSKELGEAVALSLAEGANAVLLKKHGSIAIGEDVEEAFLRALALERACITFLHS